MLPSTVWRIVVIGIGRTWWARSVTRICPFSGLTGAREPEVRRQLGVAETGGENDFRRADFTAGELDTKVAWCRADLGYRAVRKVAAAVFGKALVQRMQQAERIGVPVIRRPRRADHRRPETGEHVRELIAIEHPVFEAEIAGLGPHPLHHCVAGLELGFAETEMHAARPLVPDRDSGLSLELGGERGPFIRRAPRPALVMRRAVALALHPDEPEIAARGAITRHRPRRGARPSSPCAGEPIGDRRADQPAADHDRIVALH